MSGSTLVFDIETDGLLAQCKTIHCLGIYEIETDQLIMYNDEGNSEPISRGIQRLQDADRIIGHGIIGFDIPVIHKLYPWFDDPGIVVDTLLLSRLYHPDMIKLDHKRSIQGMPLQLYGRHNLESYGYRLKEFKGCFSKTTDWKQWSPEMEEYCAQDVRLTTKLCKYFEPYLNGSS